MQLLTLRPLLAVGITPGLTISSVVGGLVMLGLAAWFFVISHDLATHYRRFGDIDGQRRSSRDAGKPSAIDRRSATKPQDSRSTTPTQSSSKAVV